MEHDLTRADGERRRIFNASWSGLITFHELNDKLSQKLVDYDWGSFGDDAIYKFLDANAIRWNNGEATKQITTNGAKQRFYILDDARCPVPSKSYKDLAPKQLEAIHKDYLFAKKEIAEEQKRYDEAVADTFKHKEWLVEWLEMTMSLNAGLANLPNMPNMKRKFKAHGLYGKSPQEAYELIMSGKVKLDAEDSSQQKTIDLIKEQELIVKRGVRSVEQILEDISSGVSKRGPYQEIC